MAKKSSGRRCPACGSAVLENQKYCSRCGAVLAAAKPIASPNRLQTFLGKAFVALIALAFVFGVVSRLLDDDQSAPRPSVVSSNVDPRPTRTARPATRTAEPPTRTPVPPTRTSAPPTHTDVPDTPRPSTQSPTKATSTVQPATATRSISSTTTTIRQSISTAQPVPSLTAKPATTAPPPQPTEAPSRTPIPPTSTSIPPTATASGLALASTDCSGYDAWEWAQSVYESDPSAFSGLDTDGDGTACPNLPSGGFAPAFWLASLPDGLEQGTIDAIIDGDTFEITVDGQTSRYRLYRADTPEVGENMQCGGTNATDFVRFALGFNDTPGQVWIESDGQRDPYGRQLAYLWFTVAGEPYLLNHVLINNGWAENNDYGDDFDPYPAQLRSAAAFAQQHRLGVWSQCGGFGVALPTPTSVPTQAPFPTQAPLPTDAPYVAPTQAPAMNLGGGGCDPNYTPCVPDVPYDLDCGDIRFGVQVIGYDRHRFDADNDGYGCESY